MRWTILALALAGCVTTTDAGCVVYGAQRVSMPRPVPEGDLGRWVAVTDAAMTGACR
ncbi:hypothetical protein [Pseudogemmobacter sonorensis]|uniref:hypothetical protein n=1 Tax=Pseudogemmobacter sonorensis TaxID=2989681 RepID=UPI0036961166